MLCNISELEANCKIYLKIEFKMITGGACALKEAASTILEHLTWK
jgi:hypothetical protein